MNTKLLTAFFGRRRSTLAIVIHAASLVLVHSLSAQGTASSARNEESDMVELEPFEVLTDKGTRRYGASSAVGGTHVNATIASTPQSVVSFNQEFLKDNNPTDFSHALRFVSGISKVEGKPSAAPFSPNRMGAP